MRRRDIFYIAIPLLCAVASSTAAAAAAGWGPAWRQTVPAGGPVSLSRALVAIAPPGQTVVVDLPGALKRTDVRWPAGERKAALRAAVLGVDHSAEIALGERCAGEILTVYSRAPALAQELPVGAPSTTRGPAGASTPMLVSSPSMARTQESAPKATVSRAPVVPKVWLISKGELMSTALDRWGSSHGWTVVWKARRIAKYWHAPAFAAIPGTFLSAVGLWAHSAIANGAPIRLIEYRANNTLVVESTDGDDNGF
ncbi:MAG: TcpQ domain-containing protein [Steroidobacteraceae bacterium]